MESRLLNLLRILVDEYVTTAEAVGSQHLVERYRLDVSPATIRNWFAELEADELVMQPHTSGGRVPTEKGFREYVKQFVEAKPAPRKEVDALRKAATSSKDDAQTVKNVAKALAELSGQAAIAGLSVADTFYTGLSQLFVQPEFKNWQRVVSLSEILDRLDETLNALRHGSFVEPRILLGRECPFGPSCGVVMASLDGNLIGLLGPMRMDYQQALSLIQTALAVTSTK